MATATLGVLSPAIAVADPNSGASQKIVAFPGMSIVQGDNRCTLGSVDTTGRVGITAGHCNASGPVADINGNAIGDVLAVDRNLPAGGAITPGDTVLDFESVALAPGIALSDALPNGTHLRTAQAGNPQPGMPVCLMGSVSGESCGTVDAVNNGWFTMTGIAGQHGDSGGPVYSTGTSGEAVLVGIYVLRWGGEPAAMSWPAISAQMQSQPTSPAPENGG